MLTRLSGTFTPDQVARFRAMFADPLLSIDEIGETFSVQRSTVYRLAQDFDCPPCPERRAVQGRRSRDRATQTARIVRSPSVPACAYDALPASALHGRPARPRLGDRRGERWIQLI